MRYSEFRRQVIAAGWSDQQLRFEVPPSAALLDLLGEVDRSRHGRYQVFLSRYFRERATKLAKLANPEVERGASCG
jgi:hypothetical protein